MKKHRDPKWLRKWKQKEKKAKVNWDSYAIRNKALESIGFSNYADYLASPLWQEIRKKRLTSHPTCFCCDNTADVVHHRFYYKKLLLGDEESVNRDLFPLCNSCHYKVEFDGERKRSSGEAVKVFGRMLFKTRNGMSKSQMIRNEVNARRKS